MDMAKITHLRCRCSRDALLKATLIGEIGSKTSATAQLMGDQLIKLRFPAENHQWSRWRPIGNRMIKRGENVHRPDGENTATWGKQQYDFLDFPLIDCVCV